VGGRGDRRKLHKEYLDGLYPSTHIRVILILIYLLTAIGLTSGGSSTVHLKKRRTTTTQLTLLVGIFYGIRTQSGQTKIKVELTA
jgi:hypothetical protein